MIISSLIFSIKLNCFNYFLALFKFYYNQYERIKIIIIIIIYKMFLNKLKLIANKTAIQSDFEFMHF